MKTGAGREFPPRRRPRRRPLASFSYVVRLLPAIDIRDRGASYVRGGKAQGPPRAGSQEPYRAEPRGGTCWFYSNIRPELALGGGELGEGTWGYTDA